MENDQPFELDAEINALGRLTSRSRQRSSHKGRDALGAAFGPSVSHKERDHENTPLLQRDSDEEVEAGGNAEHESDDGRAPPSWEGERDFEGRPWWKRPSVFWLLPCFAAFTIAFGGTIVPRINLIMDLICRNYFAQRSMQDPAFDMMPVILGDDNPQCKIPEVSALVTKFLLYGALISGLLSAVVSPKLGALSDQYGRLRVMCCGTMGLLLQEVVIICVATWPDKISVNWILLGFTFDGLGGSFIAAMAISYAYASDCTSPQRRNVVFGWYQSVLFGGIALGPILGGYIVKLTGKILNVFYVALGMHIVFVLVLLLVVPESLSKERQLAARQKKKDVNSSVKTPSLNWSSDPVASTWSFIKSCNLLEPLSILWPTGEGTNPAVRRNLVLIAAVDTTMFGVAMGSLTVVLLYVELEFGWGNYETSIFVSVVNTCRAFTLIVLLPIVIRLLRGPKSKVVPRNSGSDNIDLGIIRAAILFDILGYVGYTLARRGELFILCGAAASLGGIGSPTLQAALTKHVPHDRTGQVLGAVGLLHAAARVVAPTVFSVIYAKTVGKFRQTVFVCLAATFGVALVLSWFIRPHVYWDEPHKVPTSGDSDEEINDHGVLED